MSVRSTDGAGRVSWREVGIFLALAFGIAWALEIAAIAGGMRFEALEPAGGVLLILVMFVPGLSAFLVRRFITREGFSTAGLRWGPKRYYLMVWLGVPALFAVVYLLTAALGLGTLDLTGRSALEQIRAAAGPGAEGAQLPSAGVLLAGVLIASLTMGMLVTTVATFGEEFGWTGYLLPHLLPLGRWRAAVLYGVIWGAWHAPVVWAGYNYPGYGLLGVGMMLLFTTAVALMQTGVWLRSGSVLLTSFLHAGINAQARGIWPLIVADVHPLLGGIVGVVGIAVLGGVGAWLLASYSGREGTA